MNKIGRDPEAILHDQLLKLKESEEWQIYRGILAEQYRVVYNTLAEILVTPEQIASHNGKVGLLSGMKKALDYLEVKIEELERKEHANANKRS